MSVAILALVNGFANCWACESNAVGAGRKFPIFSNAKRTLLHAMFGPRISRKMRRIPRQYSNG